MTDKEAMQQSWELHIEQADAIRGLLDLHAPETDGNLQTRLAKVLAQPVQPVASPSVAATKKLVSEFTIADLAIEHLGSYAEKDYDFALAILNAAAIAQPVQPAVTAPSAYALKWPDDSRINLSTVFDTLVEAKEYADRCATKGVTVVSLYTAAQSVQPTPDADFKESVGLMLAAVGYTETYALQFPKEKVSITFKRWFDEQIENAKLSQPVQLAAEALVAAARKVMDEFGTSSDGLRDLYQALKAYAAPQPIAQSVPPRANDLVLQLSELMRGLEMHPTCANLAPGQLYLIGEAICTQAKLAQPVQPKETK